MVFVPLKTLLVRTTVLALALLSSTASASQKPLGSANQHPFTYPPAAVNFSVGFSLQSSYGAVAVIFEGKDGELETHARIHHGDKDYQDVMTRLSLPSSRHLAPPYQDMEEHFNDVPRRALRNSRKKAGIPASHDVGVLARVLEQLRAQLQEEFGVHVSEAVFTSAHLLALYQDDLTDIADHLGIEYVTPKRQFYPIFWETGAAYAGYGLGLCDHPRDPERCTDESNSLPDINLLSVHYSRHALTVGFAPIATAVGAFEPDPYHHENFTLGSDAMGHYSNPDDYWSGVKDILLRTMRAYPLPGPHKIMMTGDMAHDQDFLKFMEETINEHKGFVPPVLSDGALTAAARGAAELMRRGPAPWGPGPY